MECVVHTFARRLTDLGIPQERWWKHYMAMAQETQLPGKDDTDGYAHSAEEI